MARRQVSVSEEQIVVTVNGKEVEKTYNDLVRAARKLRAEQKNLAVQGKTNTEEFKENAKALKLLDKEMTAAQKASQGMQKTAGPLRKAIQGIGASIKAAFAPLAILAAVVELVNLAKEVFNVTQEFQKSREEINRFSGLTGQALSEANAQAQSLANTFEVDVNEVIKDANAASEAFGIDFTESLDLIEKGLLAVGTQGEEFLEQVKEYSPQLKAAGLSAEQAFAVIANSLNEGVFSDKGADAIKEFNLRIKDLSQGQREVLEQTLGTQFTDKLVTAIETGEKTSVQALGEIAGEMDKLGADSAATQKIVSNLFGGPGEDAGAEFLISLQNVDQSMNDLIDTSNVYVKRQIEQLQLEKEVAQAQEELSMALDGSGAFFQKTGTLIKKYFYEALAGVVNFIKYFPEYWEIMKIGTLNQLAAVGNAIFEFLVYPINEVLKLVGQDPIEWTPFEVDVEGQMAAIHNLQNQIKADKEAFAKEQERQAAISAGKAGAAERAQRLRDAKETGKAVRNATSRELEQLAKLEADAQRNIEALRIALMEEGAEKQIAMREAQAQKEKDAVKGNAVQVAEQIRLINQKLELDLQKIRNEGADKRIADIQEAAARELALSTNNAEARKSIIETAQAAISDIIENNSAEQQALARSEEEKLAIQKEAAQKQVDAINALMESRLSAQEAGYQKEIAALELAAKEKAIKATQRAATSLSGGDDPAAAEELLKMELLNIEEQFLQDKLDLQEAYGIDSTDLRAEIAARELEAERAAAQESANIQQERFQKILGYAEQIGSVFQSIFDLEAQAARNNTESQLEELEARKQAELEAAGDNAARKEVIEKRYAKKEEEIQKAQARKEKEIALKKAIIEQAIAIAKAVGSAPFPANIPAIAFATVQAGLQIAAISAQQFADGGFTDAAWTVGPDGNLRFEQKPVKRTRSFAAGGRVSQPTLGLIGERGSEWVANNQTLRDPITGPVVQRLERIQSGAMPRSSIRGVAAFAEGGFTQPEQQIIARPSDQAIAALAPVDNSQLIAVLSEQNRILMAILAKPFTEQDAVNISDMAADYAARVQNQSF